MKVPCKLSRLSLSGMAAIVLVLTGCTETEIREVIVEVERPFFEDPPAAAQNYLGYGSAADQEDNLTVCGNCHVGQQSEWEETGHPHAWEEMEESGLAQESCESCHAVSENGNSAEDAVAWTATGDPRYHDVQCEHVTNPDANAKPLSSIAVGVDLTSGCGECHRAEAADHKPFVEEWSQSRHGEGANRPQYRDREGCLTCHGGRGALEAWGVDDTFLEKVEDTQGIGIVCAVCHDPHDARNHGQLRFAIDVPDVDLNLCMRCHQRRAVPDVESSRGPHSPQGPLLLGENVGWTPPDFPFGPREIVGTHGTEANPRLCATCHVSPVETASAITSGHLFKPIPCLDAQGLPTASEECAEEERSFQACTASGCHGTQVAARSAFTVAKARIAALVEELDVLLALVPDSEFNTEDGVYTVAEGAFFNQRLGEIRSSAIHNAFLTEALLVASIEALENEYGVQASIQMDLRARLEELGRLSAR
jgi:predicted CXXCH cytochrome family protein